MFVAHNHKDFARMLVGPPAKTATSLDRAIQIDQHLAMSSQTIQIAIIVCVSALMSAYIAHVKGADPAIWIWAGMCTFMAFLAFADRFRRIGKSVPEQVSGRYLKRSEYIAIIYGVIWGTTPFFMGEHAETAIFVGLIALPGMMAGLTALLPYTPRISMRFTFFSGLGMLAYLATVGTSEAWLLYTLLIAFVSAVYMGAYRTYNNFTSTIASRERAKEAHALVLRAVNATGQAFAYVDGEGARIIQNDLHQQVFADQMNFTNLGPADTTVERSGRFWQYRAQPVESGGYVVVHTDVSEIERAKRDLEVAKQEADAANAAKSRFYKSMSRELKVPLDIITGCSEIMGGDSNIEFNPEEVRNYADQISEQARYLTCVIDEIISYTKLEHVELSNNEELVDVEDAIQSALSRTRQSLRNFGKIEFDISIEPNLPNIVYDRTALERIILHLTSNGVEHSVNTPVVVKVSQLDGRGVLIMVRDQGRGMSQKDLERAFEPFYQGESREQARNGGGIGLGLTVSRKLARAHGGDIILRSSEGAGTSAFFIIPNSRCIVPKMITAENLKSFFEV